MKNRILFLDYDLNKPPFCFMNVEEARELIYMDVLRLKRMFKLGKAIIKRSLNGFHVKFPFDFLNVDEVNAILLESLCDKGYKYYSIEKGKQCLRISDKKIVVESNKGKRLYVKTIRDEPYIEAVL